MSTFKRAQFQEAAVEHIVARLRDASGSRRMLLADEVGLGKTVVARGVIERLLERRRKPLTVIYLCSNAEIAEQNRKKLDPSSRRPVGRVTELALERRDDDAGLLLYSFTPGTSLKDGTGLAWERRLLLYLLYRIYGCPVWTKAWREFFRCGAGEGHWYEDTAKHRLRNEFDRKTSSAFQAELATAWRSQILEGQDLIQVTRESVAVCDLGDGETRTRRNRLIARLRGVMQRVVLRHLQPDLVVLDEVQRFREVLDEAASAEHIAAELFTRRIPVLILSATPYRALTLGHEVADGAASHHEDFFNTLNFLFDQDKETPRRIRANLKAFGERLQSPSLAERLDPALVELKRGLEDDLTKVICRTERNWYVLDRRKGVEDATGDSGALPSRGELDEYFRLHRTLVASQGASQVTEFWKSAPSLLTFLDAKYALFRRLRDDRVRVPRALLTRGDDVKSLADRNHRISRVVNVALGEGDTPPRLWTAPTYTYYRDELFGASRPRKLLVFSGWRFVPKTVAIIASRVATDRMGGELESPTQPLRFSERRSFHAFDACFPSPVLARVGDEAYLALLHEGTGQDALRVVREAERRLRLLLHANGVPVVPSGGDPTWRVAMRLESAEGRGRLLKDALDAWDSDEREDGATEAVVQHREWAKEWLADEESPVRVSEGRVQRLALIAAFSPANCVLRSVQSVFPEEEGAEALPTIAALCLGPMRRYFNRPHVQQVIRQHRFRMPWRQMTAEGERGYTERVLVYAGDAHLQAVLDEYVYLLRHATQGETVEKAVEQLAAVWTLARGNPRTNGARGQGNNVRIEPDAESHATHFALAFGEDASRDAGPDADDEKLRKSVVREAFNSPFWPFVLATTSVGQEGLDFHLYCRDVLHWNLPSNPVDLEQREGRINRRDCLAVRESIARDWLVADSTTWGGRADRGRNPWTVVFESILAHDDVQKYKHGLFPHWVYECRNAQDTVRIQRHVPFFSTSRDAMKYERLKTGLALYRLVFGQVNQEDLLENLQHQIQDRPQGEQDKVLKRLASYMLNLSPIGHEQALKHAAEEAADLLARYPAGGGIGKLLAAVARMRAERPEELGSVGDELDGLNQFVLDSLAKGEVQSEWLGSAVAALAYLRNPYDRIFDLHVEGGFTDDVAIIQKAWASISSERRPPSAGAHSRG